MWLIRESLPQILLQERKRGFHIITSEIIYAIPEIEHIKTGICQVFIQHTSASLSINENADPTVRKDFEMFFNKTVPENDPEYLHDDEGSDDMPAHLKAALLGTSVTIPIRNGKMAQFPASLLCYHQEQSAFGFPRLMPAT